MSQEPQKNLVHGALIEAEILTSTSPPCVCSFQPQNGPNRSWDIDLPISHMYLLNSAQFLVLALCPQVCQHFPSGLYIFLCVSGTSKNLVHGALIEAEILTSTSPPCVCSFQPQIGPNRSWDIDLPISPMYLLNSAQFWVLALCPQVCQHFPSGLYIFLCVSGTSKKI